MEARRVVLKGAAGHLADKRVEDAAADSRAFTRLQVSRAVEELERRARSDENREALAELCGDGGPAGDGQALVGYKAPDPFKATIISECRDADVHLLDAVVSAFSFDGAAAASAVVLRCPVDVARWTALCAQVRRL